MSSDDESDPPEFALEGSIASNIALATEIVVRKGAKVSVRYNVDRRGIKASDVAKEDEEYRRLLTKTECEEYDRKKDAYKGGLDIPMLVDLGADLRRPVKKDGMMIQRRRVRRYNRKARAASKALRKLVASDIKVRGNLTAEGVSDTPTQAHVLVHFAEVTLNDRRKVSIYSETEQKMEPMPVSSEKMPIAEKLDVR